MLILAIDTSSAATSVAVTEGDHVLAKAEHVDPRHHAEVLAPMVAEILQSLEQPHVDLVAVGVGPGPYTGLRVGIATAQALALAWRVPIVGACSLDVIAARADIAGALVVASDARRREVYWARYEHGVRVDGPRVDRPAHIAESIRSLPACGEGVLLHADAFADPRAPELRFPDAGTLGALTARLLAAGVEPQHPSVLLAEHGSDDGATARSLGDARLLTAAPLYVRRPDAAEPKAAS